MSTRKILTVSWVLAVVLFAVGAKAQTVAFFKVLGRDATLNITTALLSDRSFEVGSSSDGSSATKLTLNVCGFGDAELAKSNVFGGSIAGAATSPEVLSGRWRVAVRSDPAGSRPRLVLEIRRRDGVPRLRETRAPDLEFVVGLSPQPDFAHPGIGHLDGQEPLSIRDISARCSRLAAESAAVDRATHLLINRSAHLNVAGAILDLEFCDGGGYALRGIVQGRTSLERGEWTVANAEIANRAAAQAGNPQLLSPGLYLVLGPTAASPSGAILPVSVGSGGIERLGNVRPVLRPLTRGCSAAPAQALAAGTAVPGVPETYVPEPSAAASDPDPAPQDALAAAPSSELAQAWAERLRGFRLVQMSQYNSGSSGGMSSRTSIDLCREGHFKFNGASSIVMNTSNGASASGSRNHLGSGAWQVTARGTTPILQLSFHDGGVREYSLSSRGDVNYLDGERWYKVNDSNFASTRADCP